MKKMLRLSMLGMTLFTAQSAFAINLTFQFNVNSSGTSMYACNAGIRHADTPAICLDVNTGNSCVPTPITVSSCICTSTGTSASYDRDYLKAKSADWTDRNESVGTITETETQAKNSTSSFNSLFADDETALTKQITELSLNLGSEDYGAEYFVDICYRGTQVTQGSSSNNYSLAGKVTVTNLRASETGAPNYQSLADLQGKAEVKCVMDKFATFADTIPSMENPNYIKNSGTTYSSLSTSASQLSLLSDATMSTTTGDKIPRFCITRYFFKEKATAERQWKLQQARTAIFTEIVDKH